MIIFHNYEHFSLATSPITLKKKHFATQLHVAFLSFCAILAESTLLHAKKPEEKNSNG